MNKELPEALRLATRLDSARVHFFGINAPVPKPVIEATATELRRLHERNAELERVLGVARASIDQMKDCESYSSEEDECGRFVCCDQISYKGHVDDCHATTALTEIDRVMPKKEGV